MVIPSGDLVSITEQTLDGTCFMVINLITGEKGRVPMDYIHIGEVLEGYNY